MSYDPSDFDPYRRRPTHRPTPPATTTTPPPIPPVAPGLSAREKQAWLEYLEFAADPSAALIGAAMNYTKAKLSGGEFWTLTDDVLAAAERMGRVWTVGRFGEAIDPAHAFRHVMMNVPFGDRFADEYGELVRTAARYADGDADRGAMLEVAEVFGEAVLTAWRVIHLVRGDHDGG